MHRGLLLDLYLCTISADRVFCLAVMWGTALSLTIDDGIWICVSRFLLFRNLDTLQAWDVLFPSRPGPGGRPPGVGAHLAVAVPGVDPHCPGARSPTFVPVLMCFALPTSYASSQLPCAVLTGGHAEPARILRYL